MPAKTDRAAAPETAPTVFDCAHLLHYAMQDQALAQEVLGLFLVQLPAMLTALEAAAGPEDWHFATHTLKGSAGSIGALRLRKLAAELESMPFEAGDPVRLLRIQAVRAAAAEFRAAVRPASG